MADEDIGRTDRAVRNIMGCLVMFGEIILPKKCLFLLVIIDHLSNSKETKITAFPHCIKINDHMHKGINDTYQKV